MHGGNEVTLAELDLHHSLRLQHTTTCAGVCKRLYVRGVDLAVHNHPGTSAQLGAARDVHKHGLLVHPELLNDQAARLQHTIKEVALPTCKATPVGDDEQWQSFTVKLLNCLSSLVGRVREPDLHLQSGRWSRFRPVSECVSARV